METTDKKTMEIITTKKTLVEDKQLLILTHLSQLLDFATGIGGFIVPLVLWLTKKDEVKNMDAQGKAIINFKISMFIYFVISAILLLVAIGVIGFIIFGIISFIFPIVNAINVSNDKEPYYPLSIEFLK